MPANVDIAPEAAAAVLNDQIASADLLRETRWPVWRSEALSHGVRAVESTPIASTTGQVVGVLSVLRDQPDRPAPDRNLVAQFTQLAGIAIERARGEAALKQSEAFLAKAQRISSTGTFSWRVATGEITWSEEIYRIYELDPAIPATFALIDTRLHPDDMPSHDEMRRQQRRDGRDFEHEHRLLMPDGSVKHLRLDAHATWDDDGQLEYIGAIQDITERRLSEEALGRVRSELAHLARVATLGALTASIAHEVNQPLAGIITNANTCLRMLAADPPNVDGARETARRTIRDGNRASDVIKRLRALFAKKGTATEDLNLNEATQEVIAMLLDDLQRRGILLQTEFAADLAPVAGDRVQLQQVILNLLLNASDAMHDIVDRPRLMVVGTEQDGGDRVRLTVRDTGAGFAPEDADRLFTAFYTTKREGMGIGLSISRSIIESHDGRLWATANDGPGATFAFSIPHRPETANDARGGNVNRPVATSEQNDTVETY
ncbi:MAG: ATP-binding protein [Luteimonas sp.]|nr:ATP-binding protein [Luteimonas sp.]